MKCGQKGSKLKEDVDTVGPDSYILLSDRERDKLHQKLPRNPGGPGGFDDATFIPGHGIRGSATITAIGKLKTSHAEQDTPLSAIMPEPMM